MAILEKTITSGFLKARTVMKIDIVKPIPPSIPAPKICAHFKFLGSTHKPEVTPTDEKSKIPSGLPTTRPRIIPYVLT
ncbi:hypothetical protein D3C80_1652190 [compost metagenome]